MAKAKQYSSKMRFMNEENLRKHLKHIRKRIEGLRRQEGFFERELKARTAPARPE